MPTAKKVKLKQYHQTDEQIRVEMKRRADQVKDDPKYQAKKVKL